MTLDLDLSFDLHLTLGNCVFCKFGILSQAVTSVWVLSPRFAMLRAYPNMSLVVEQNVKKQPWLCPWRLYWICYPLNMLLIDSAFTLFVMFCSLFGHIKSRSGERKAEHTSSSTDSTLKTVMGWQKLLHCSSDSRFQSVTDPSNYRSLIMVNAFGCRWSSFIKAV